MSLFTSASRDHISQHDILLVFITAGNFTIVQVCDHLPDPFLWYCNVASLTPSYVCTAGYYRMNVIKDWQVYCILGQVSITLNSNLSLPVFAGFAIS